LIGVEIQSSNNKHHLNKSSEKHHMTNKLYLCGEDSYLPIATSSSCHTLQQSIPLPFNCDIKLISCGYGHVVLVNTDDEIYSFGHNSNGQLGLGDNVSRKQIELVVNEGLNGQKIKQIACGYVNTFIVTESNEIWAAGCNSNGQLGIGTNHSVNNFHLVPLKLPSSKSRSHSADSNKMIVNQISPGHTHTLLLTSGNILWATGKNSNGSFGVGHITSSHTFMRINGPENVLHGMTIKQISSGLNQFTYVLTKDNRLFATGRNNNCELCLGNTTDTCTYQQVNVPLQLHETIEQIYCGSNHIVILTSFGRLLTGGHNGYGQCCVSVQSHIVTTFQAVAISNFNIKRIIATSPTHSTIVITDKDEILSAGCNGVGQLAVGDTLSKNTFQTAPLQLEKGEKIMHAANGYCVIAIVTGSYHSQKNNLVKLLDMQDNLIVNDLLLVSDTHSSVSLRMCSHLFLQRIPRYKKEDIIDNTLTLDRKTILDQEALRIFVNFVLTDYISIPDEEQPKNDKEAKILGSLIRLLWWNEEQMRSSFEDHNSARLSELLIHEIISALTIENCVKAVLLLNQLGDTSSDKIQTILLHMNRLIYEKYVNKALKEIPCYRDIPVSTFIQLPFSDRCDISEVIIRDPLLVSDLRELYDSGQGNIRLLAQACKEPIMLLPAILSCNSPFFMTMFSSGFQQSDSVNLDELLDYIGEVTENDSAIRFKAFSSIVKYWYTGEMSMTEETAVTVLSMCDFFQIDDCDPIRVTAVKIVISGFSNDNIYDICVRFFSGPDITNESTNTINSSRLILREAAVSYLAAHWNDLKIELKRARRIPDLIYYVLEKRMIN
jgi:alpha-tubulin suppressor-like RCC1 family protein